jgi:DNA-directed RNA polymerase specialized sigma24 family protein
MNETRQSLLLRAQTGATAAWKDLTDLYRPLILSWLHRQSVPARDLEDLSQEVLLSVVKQLPWTPTATPWPPSSGWPTSSLPFPNAA